MDLDATRQKLLTRVVLKEPHPNDFETIHLYAYENPFYNVKIFFENGDELFFEEEDVGYQRYVWSTEFTKGKWNITLPDYSRFEVTRKEAINIIESIINKDGVYKPKRRTWALAERVNWGGDIDTEECE